MKITFLGTGNAFAPQRDWECMLVNDSILLDAGPSMLVNLKRLGVDPTAIRHIFITHFHGDHYFGLPFLLLEYEYMSPTDTPMSIIGPPGIEQQLYKLMELAYPGHAKRGWPRPIRFIEAGDGVTDTVDGVTFTPIHVEHSPETITAFGYRLHLPDGILAYTGDTSMTEALNELFKDARVLIVEAASEEANHVHLGREALRAILADIPPDSVVFVNHLDTLSADPWAEYDVIVPEDRQTFTIDFSGGMPAKVSYD